MLGGGGLDGGRASGRICGPPATGDGSGVGSGGVGGGSAASGMACNTGEAPGSCKVLLHREHRINAPGRIVPGTCRIAEQDGQRNWPIDMASLGGRGGVMLMVPSHRPGSQVRSVGATFSIVRSVPPEGVVSPF